MPVRVIVLLLAVLIGIGALYWAQADRERDKVSGYIEADEIRVGSRVGGRVAQVLVDEGARTEPGQTLVRLEPFDLRERLAEAQAQLVAAEAELAEREAGFRVEEVRHAEALRDQARAAHQEAQAGPRTQEIDEARQSLRLAEAELELAEPVFRRTEKLYGDKSVPKEEYDRALSELKVARARVDANKARLAMLEEGTRPEQIAQAKANLEAAQAQLELFQNGYRAEQIAQARATADAMRAKVAAIGAQLDELEVRAPVASTVEAVELESGDLIAANAPVISLMDTRTIWVRAYLPEDLLGRVKEGQELDVYVDSFPGRRFAGRVSFISRNAEFTPSNVQTPEERSKQVYRIKVELVEGLDVLRPGMAADVFLKEPFNHE